MTAIRFPLARYAPNPNPNLGRYAPNPNPNPNLGRYAPNANPNPNLGRYAEETEGEVYGTGYG